MCLVVKSVVKKFILNDDTEILTNRSGALADKLLFLLSSDFVQQQQLASPAASLVGGLLRLCGEESDGIEEDLHRVATECLQNTIWLHQG